MSDKYYLASGTVQPYVSGPDGFFKSFGRAQYERGKPVLTDSLREQGQAVCDELNNGTITRDEALERLRKIYF